MKEGDKLAITKIWAVKDDLRRVLNYIENPDKTKEDLGDGLKEVLAYTTQGYKTNEKEYITGINCEPNTSLKQMMIQSYPITRWMEDLPFMQSNLLNQVK